MSVDSGSGDDLSGAADDIAESFEEIGGFVLDDWSTRAMVSTMVPLLTALSILQMVSGSVLAAYEAVLVANPALLVLVPVQIGTAGNLGSIMCSRLSTQLHLGTLELSWANPDVRANSGAIISLGFTIFVIVGVAAWAIGRAFGDTLALWQVMTISLASGMLLAVFVVIVSLIAVTASFQLGYNPDDTTIPIVTNISDITGVLILFGVVNIVL